MHHDTHPFSPGLQGPAAETAEGARIADAEGMIEAQRKQAPGTSGAPSV